MDLKEFYKEFEAEVKKRLSADLWEKSLAKGDPEGFAKELAAAEFTPEEAAEEYEEMIEQMEKEGSFNEDNGEDAEPWSVEFKDIWDNVQKETFKDEQSAWARYNELSARTHGDMSDILWVEEPKGPVSEDGSSAASLGVGPNAARHNEEFTKDDVDAFTIDDPNYVDHALLGDDESIVIKVAKEPSTREFKIVAMLQGANTKPEKKTIKTGGLIDIVNFYSELLGMPMENAITLIENA